SPKLHFYYL
nr:Chain E, Nucleoprotein peptide N75-83 [Human coronavirus 229E]7LGT_F Chain F, Nucleoprotein peptide N75-83 [Human coronavirus 229E]